MVSFLSSIVRDRSDFRSVFGGTWGAPGFDSGQTDEGVGFVFHGASPLIASGTSLSASARLERNVVGANLGFDVASAGDVNGDGYADVITGAPSLLSNVGAALIFHGSSSGVGALASELSGGGGFGAGRFGYSVGGAGNVNGDGFADVIAGASRYFAGQLDEGAATVMLGTSGRGRSVEARQLRDDGSGIAIAPWGATNDGDSFQVSMRATDSRGRGKVKLQVEACAAGAGWGSPTCLVRTTSTWVDVGATSSGVVLTRSIGPLSANLTYRWRARLLFAPQTVTAAGITSPPNPANGPWRYPTALSTQGDLRTVPEAGTASGLAAGMLALVAWGRRMRAGGIARRSKANDRDPDSPR